MLGQYPIHMIKVMYPLEGLRKREIARKNRCLDSAEAYYIYLFPKDGYDLTVDIHMNTASECAFKIY